MHLNLKYIEATDFLSYDHFKFVINPGLYVIEGWNEDGGTSNGSGKSAIMDALTWCIYGATPRGVKSAECVKFGKDKTVVTIEFSISNKDNYKIQRSATHGSTGLEIWKNDLQVTKETRIKLQSYIYEVIGVSYDIFNQIIYFPQNYHQKFLLSSPESKKDILFKIAKLDKIDVIYESICEDYRVHEQSVKTLESSLGQLIYKMNQLKTHHNDLKIKVDSFAQEKAKDLSSIDSELSSVDAELEQKNRQFENLKRIKDTREDEAIKLAKERAVEVAKIRKMDEWKQERLLLKDKLSNLMHDVVNYDRELQSVTDVHSKCPYCLQMVTKDFSTSQTVLLKSKIAESNKLQNQYQDRVFKIEQAIQKHYDICTNKIAQFDRELNAFSQVDTELRTASELRSSLISRKNTLMSHRGKIMAAPNAYAEMASKVIDDMRELLKMMQDEKNKLVKEKDHKKSLAALRKIFGPNGIKSLIINQIIDELNRTIQEYLSILYEQSIEIKFSIDAHITPKMGVSYKILTEFFVDGKEWAFNGLSGGEKRRAIIAIDIALAKVMTRRYGSGCNVLILDEVTTDLDVYSRSKFYDLLGHIGEDRSIYLIDHATDKDNIPNTKTIYVHKKDGHSKLLMDEMSNAA